MQSQAWVVLLMFIICIIYSIVMTAKSAAFRKLYDLNNAWMIMFFFIIILALAALLVYGTHCSVAGEYTTQSCSAYAWTLVGLVVIATAVFIGMTTYVQLHQNKNQKKNA